MIVEITGATGSGKTTLSREVIRTLRTKGYRVVAVHPDNAIGGNQSLRNLSWDVRASAMLPKLLWKQRAFLSFAIKAIGRYADSPWTAVNLLRSVLRKIAVYEWHRSRFSDPTVIVLDEGPIHTAHQLFVHVNSVPNDEALDTFWKVVPKPDLIVHLTAPLQAIHDRTHSRTDPPRRRNVRTHLATYVENAGRLFERLFIRVSGDGNVAAVNMSVEEKAEDTAAGIEREISSRLRRA